jgi:hypothetical protein
MALLTKRRSRLTPIGLIFQALRDYARYKRLVKLEREFYCIKFLTIVVLVQVSFVTPSFNIKNILTQLLSALSRHTLRNQKNINDRVVIAMTEKFTPVQLGSEKISYRHDATQ